MKGSHAVNARTELRSQIPYLSKQCSLHHTELVLAQACFEASWLLCPSHSQSHQPHQLPPATQLLCCLISLARSMAQCLPKRRAGESAGPVCIISYKYLNPKDEGRHAGGQGGDMEDREQRGPVKLVAQLLGRWGLLWRCSPPGCLCHAVRHVGSHCAHLLSPSHMEHLVIKEDMWADLLQEGALGCSRQEQGLIRLQAPAAQGLESPGPRTGCTASRHQVGADGTLQPQAFGVELLLQPTQCFQKTL